MWPRPILGSASGGKRREDRDAVDGRAGLLVPSRGKRPTVTGFSSDAFSVEVSGGVGTLWLDRAERRNTMGRTFFEDLPKAMGLLSTDPGVRAVVIAAKGRDFSVGLDLKEMGELLAPPDSPSAASAPTPPSMAARAQAARASILRLQRSISAVADCPKPVIVAVQGYCIGGGVDLISACDIRVASSDAIFSVRETRIAIVADLGSLQRLPRIVGAGHLAELAFTGGDVDAVRARDIGLVNDVLPDAEATVEAARDLAARCAANSPLAVQGVKAVLAAGQRHEVEEGLDYVATWNAGMLASDDLVEAVTAFMQKRPPEFTGG